MHGHIGIQKGRRLHTEWAGSCHAAPTKTFPTSVICPPPSPPSLINRQPAARSPRPSVPQLVRSLSSCEGQTGFRSRGIWPFPSAAPSHRWTAAKWTLRLDEDRRNFGFDNETRSDACKHSFTGPQDKSVWTNLLYKSNLFWKQIYNFLIHTIAFSIIVFKSIQQFLDLKNLQKKSCINCTA